MGGAPSLNPFIITITLTILIIIAGAEDDSSKEKPPPIPSLENDNGATATSPPVAVSTGKRSDPFKPSSAVVMGVLITFFALTFLLLLYIKHCNGAGHTFIAREANSTGAQPSHERKNSGIERAVVESLPIFRFGSLRGQKSGLDCAVCLTRFEDPEVLRLLPKCKHAFHLECVDTWLDAHSTCPLCRYKVDPEDIVLVDAKVPPQQQQSEEEEAFDIERVRKNNNNGNDATQQPETLGTRRVSGRHSSAGERDDGFLEIVLQKSNEDGQNGQGSETSSFRRSLDSAVSRKNIKTEGVVGSVVRTTTPRKDGTLLKQESDVRTSAEHRLEHRIIVSPGGPHHQQHSQCNQRWSNVQPSDLLYLTSEMIISDASSARGGRRTVRERNRDGENGGGVVMNLRSVSAMTGMSRFLGGNNRGRGRGGGEAEEGAVSRWLGGLISKSQRRADER